MTTFWKSVSPPPNGYLCGWSSADCQCEYSTKRTNSLGFCCCCCCCCWSSFSLFDRRGRKRFLNITLFPRQFFLQFAVCLCIALQKRKMVTVELWWTAQYILPTNKRVMSVTVAQWKFFFHEKFEFTINTSSFSNGKAAQGCLRVIFQP